MTGKIVLFAGIGLLAAAAAVMLWLAASGVTLWPESVAAPTPQVPVHIPPPPQATAPMQAAIPDGPPPPATAVRETPAFDPATLGARCMAFAKRNDTDPAMLAADQRMCDCFGRTLKGPDYAMMLAFTDIDPKAADAATRYAALYREYGLSEAQYATELNRIRRAGKVCMSPH